MPSRDSNLDNAEGTQTTDKREKNEFFEYLAYHGVKNQKAAELEKLKAAEELASCTFKPNL